MQKTIGNKADNTKAPNSIWIGTILGQINVVASKIMQTSLLPKVEAAAPNEPPKKPPKMKYKDLPLYDCPHMKFQNFEYDKDGCPDQNVKLLHEALLPYVKEYRKDVANALGGFKQEMISTYKEISTDFRTAERQFLSYMRNPKNRNVSLGFMGAAALIGLRMGKTMPKRLFASSLGLFVAGSICFPEETDATARKMMNLVAKAFVPLYNFYFRTDWVMRERVPCERDLPEIPKPTKPYPGCEKK